jgi:hypothetical protein
LTFRIDQVRYRRDHAKYLSMIASITLLRQYQCQRITRHGETCVVAPLDDARLANQLATSTFGLRSDGQTKRRSTFSPVDYAKWIRVRSQ